MAKPEQSMIISWEGAKELTKIHEEYLDNTPRLNWTKRRVLSHMDN